MPRRKAQPAQNATKIRKAILDAALNVAAQNPWEFVSLLEIADVAGFSLADLTDVFQDKQAIVAAIVDELDSTVEQSFSVIDKESPLRDRLFDVLMERIERANAHRAAHISFFQSFGWTKESACADLSLMKQSMTRMAKCAGMETQGMTARLKLAGVTLGYLWVLTTWMRDTSPDLGKTMAELDKTLARLEGFAEYMKF